MGVGPATGSRRMGGSVLPQRLKEETAVAFIMDTCPKCGAPLALVTLRMLRRAPVTWRVCVNYAGCNYMEGMPGKRRRKRHAT